jgi:hypothetical protein
MASDFKTACRIACYFFEFLRHYLHLLIYYKTIRSVAKAIVPLHGGIFGSFPFSGYFWRKSAGQFQSIVEVLFDFCGIRHL